jgi:hypothetical protein
MEEFAEREKKNSSDITTDIDDSTVVTVDDDNNTNTDTDDYTNMVNYSSNNM